MPNWRWWWLVPALGLVPVLIAVLAAQGAFTRQPPPVASAPISTGALAQSAQTRATSVTA
ncbi:MAG: hypothetical protein JOZ65_05420, partial [Chloroflexi bacterium]|nr:hypothetical protein [Chloroflexota bacterium]